MQDSYDSDTGTDVESTADDPSGSDSRAAGPESPPTASGGSPRRSRGAFLTILGLAAALALYAWAACHVIALSLDRINPDGVAYIRLAQYYADGRLDLAVSSYWGPLLSWLFVPVVWLGLDPHMTFKIYQVVFGLGLGGATVFLARRLGYRHTILLPATVGLGLALSMLFEPITPDLLLTVLVTLLLACGIGLLDKPTARGAAATGALAGVSYLAKAYALPFFIAMLVGIYVARRLARRGPGAKYLLLAAAVFAVIAGPWITFISAREGRVTFSTVNDSARAWSPVIADESRPLYRLHAPTDGRITSWENPPEIPDPWPVWSPLDGLEGLKRQAATAAIGWNDAMDVIVATDRFALVLAGLVLAVALMVGRRGDPDRAAARVWTCVMILIYVTGYTLVLVQERYLWPVQAAMAALALWAIWEYWPRRDAPATGADAAAPPPRRGAIAERLFVVAMSILMLASIARTVYERRMEWALSTGPRAEAEWSKGLGLALPDERPVASDDWFRALFAAYWRDVPCLGKFAGKTAQEVAAELEPFGPVCVVIWYDDKLADDLAAHTSFRALTRHRHESGQFTARVFAFDP